MDNPSDNNAMHTKPDLRVLSNINDYLSGSVISADYEVRCLTRGVWPLFGFFFYIALLGHFFGVLVLAECRLWLSANSIAGEISGSVLFDYSRCRRLQELEGVFERFACHVVSSFLAGLRSGLNRDCSSCQSHSLSRHVQRVHRDLLGSVGIRDSGKGKDLSVVSLTGSWPRLLRGQPIREVEWVGRWRWINKASGGSHSLSQGVAGRAS